MFLPEFGDSGLANKTTYNLALGKSNDDTFWSVMNSDGEGEKKGWRMKRFGMSMGVTRNPEPSRELPVSVAFDWGPLGDAKVIDGN